MMASVMPDFAGSVKAQAAVPNCDRIVADSYDFNQIAINPNDI